MILRALLKVHAPPGAAEDAYLTILPQDISSLTQFHAIEEHLARQVLLEVAFDVLRCVEMSVRELSARVSACERSARFYGPRQIGWEAIHVIKTPAREFDDAATIAHAPPERYWGMRLHAVAVRAWRSREDVIVRTILEMEGIRSELERALCDAGGGGDDDAGLPVSGPDGLWFVVRRILSRASSSGSVVREVDAAPASGVPPPPPPLQEEVVFDDAVVDRMLRAVDDGDSGAMEPEDSGSAFGLLRQQ